MKIVIDGAIKVKKSDLTQFDSITAVARNYTYYKEFSETPISSQTYDKLYIKFPRNMKKFLNVTGKSLNTFEIKDERVSKKFKHPFELSESFTLREYQENAIKKVVSTLSNSVENSAILQAGAGSGKTYTLPAVLNALKERTLIIVDRTNLAQQMYAEITANAQCDIQLLKGVKQEIADINIATFQFLIRNPKVLEKLSQEIGLVVVDECHLLSIGAFTEVVNRLPAKYRYGLSATPSRSDGLTKALFDVMGNNVISGTNPDLLPVDIYCLERPYKFQPIRQATNVMWGEFFGHPLIIEEVVKITKKALKKKRAVFVYATMSYTQDALQTAMEAEGISSAIINQKTKTKDREEIINNFSERRLDVIISGTILQKGISIHRMDTIINLANHKKEALEQTIGRLRREHKDAKPPIFIDLWFGGKARWKNDERLSVYRALQMKHKDTVHFLNEAKATKYIEKD